MLAQSLMSSRGSSMIDVFKRCADLGKVMNNSVDLLPRLLRSVVSCPPSHCSFVSRQTSKSVCGDRKYNQPCHKHMIPCHAPSLHQCFSWEIPVAWCMEPSSGFCWSHSELLRYAAQMHAYILCKFLDVRNEAAFVCVCHLNFSFTHMGHTICTEHELGSWLSWTF